MHIMPKHHHRRRRRRRPCYRLYAGYLQLCTSNYICRVHSIAAVLYLQFVLYVTLFRP